jgi:RNA polymerase sigma-70 factor, ECF subfamily
MINEKEFEVLFKSKFTALCNLSYTIVKNEDLSKDVVQQVFIKLWDKQHSLNIRGSIEAYLYRMVINTSLNQIEREKKYIRLEHHTQIIRETFDSKNENPRLIEEREKKVRMAVSELPNKCQAVFSLSRFENLSNKEIASHLGISVKTVEKHITNAFKVLHKKLKPILDQEADVITLFILCNFLLWQVGILIIHLS